MREDHKHRALDLVGRARGRAVEAEAGRRAAWRFAAELGATAREIAEADGEASQVTVQRALARRRRG